MNSAIFIPFLSFILLPAVCIVASLASSRAEAKKAAQRRHASAVCAAAKEADRRRQTESRTAKSAAAAAPKRKRGRPRKNPVPEKQLVSTPGAPPDPSAPVDAHDAAETVSPAPAAPSAPVDAHDAAETVSPAPAAPSAPVDAHDAAETVSSAPAAPSAPADAHDAAETISDAPAPEQRQAPEQKSAPRGVFAGEDVAFTGTCPKMNRDAMILHTNRLGGKGWSRVNTRCTLLVIGEKPGSQQLERAAKWHIRTITWQEWFKLAFGANALPDPAPELSLDAFAALTDDAA